MEDSFDSNLDSDFRLALKKLYKKDVLTKQKVNSKFKISSAPRIKIFY